LTAKILGGSVPLGPKFRGVTAPPCLMGSATYGYKQPMAAGGSQVLRANNVWCRSAAVNHVVWCLLLQIIGGVLDHCTEIELHPLNKVQQCSWSYSIWENPWSWSKS